MWSFWGYMAVDSNAADVTFVEMSSFFLSRVRCTSRPAKGSASAWNFPKGASAACDRREGRREAEERLVVSFARGLDGGSGERGGGSVSYLTCVITHALALSLVVSVICVVLVAVDDTLGGGW